MYVHLPPILRRVLLLRRQFEHVLYVNSRRQGERLIYHSSTFRRAEVGCHLGCHRQDQSFGKSKFLFHGVVPSCPTRSDDSTVCNPT
jgi:hypothetical protein